MYHQTLSLIQRLYMTIIHQHFDGDAFFPEINPDEWIEIERVNYQIDAKNPYSYSFVMLDKAHRI